MNFMLSLTSHICNWKNLLSFSISSAISAPLISVRIIPCSLACSFFSFSIFVLQGKESVNEVRNPQPLRKSDYSQRLLTDAKPNSCSFAYDLLPDNISFEI